MYKAIGIALLLLPARAHCADIRISEVLADPPSGLAGDANGDGLRHTYEDEFVEVANTGADTISLAAWKIGDDDAPSDAYFTFPAGTSLAPGQLLVLFGGGSPALTLAAIFVDDGRIGNGLSNGGDTIVLLDAQGDTVDLVHVASWPSDQSLTLLADGSFAAHSTVDSRPFSPGETHILAPIKTADDANTNTDNQEPETTDTENPQANTNQPPTNEEETTQPIEASPKTADYAGLFIRQILADPPDGPAGDANGDGLRHTYEDEFVELFYTGSDTLAIGGWQIGDDDIASDAYFTFPPTARIPPNNSLVIFGGGQLKRASPFVFSAGGRIGNGLSNGGDTVILLDAQGQLVDQVIGRAWPVNQSVFRASAQADFTPHATLYASPYSLSDSLKSTEPLEADPLPETEPPLETTPPPSTGRQLNIQLEISEVLADPPGDANGDGHYSPYEDEFVELFNAGETVDLSNWRLSDDDTAQQRQFSFPSGTIFKKGEYLVLFGGGQPALKEQRLVFADDGRIGDGLTNSGDRILLYNTNGDTVLSLEFSAANIDQSLHFVSGNGIPHGRLPARAPYSPGAERPLYQRFSLYAPTLRKGQKYPASLYGHYADYTDSLDARMAQWLSTDTSAASIDTRGRIHGKNMGKTRIEAWFDSLFLAQTYVAVIVPEPPPNQAPEIVSTPGSALVYAGGFYRYQVEAKDPENATIVYALAQAPTGFKLHYASGVLSGRAPLNPGRYPIRLEASDGRGGLAAQHFSLHVQKRPQLHISEVLADPQTGLRGDANGDGMRHAYEDEFVEILNRDSETVDLSGLRLADERKSSFSFPPQTYLRAGERAVVFGGGSANNAQFFRADGRIGDGLGNHRDTVYLLSADGSDTLAVAAYNLAKAPQQALVWLDSSVITHASSGVDQLFSPGRERATLRGLNLADPYLSMLVGETRRPGLIALWSYGSKHRLDTAVDWVSSVDSVIRVDDKHELHALSPGQSTISARFSGYSTPPYTIRVYRRIEEVLSFSPPDTALYLYRGQEQVFTVHIRDGERLSYTWYTNGRRYPQRKPQLSYTCCQGRIDTLHIELKRGREFLRRQWRVSQLSADKRATSDTLHANISKTAVHSPPIRAYPNPFTNCIHIAFNFGAPNNSRLDIYDAQGRHVRTLLAPSRRSGYHNAIWDGRNESGQQVASSIYFYKLQHDLSSSSGKILLLR